MSKMLSVLACSLITYGGVVLAAATDGVETMPSFEQYNIEYGRAYSLDSEEYKMRRTLFEKRASEVTHHNSQPHQNWKAVLNHLSDRTEEELAALRGWKGVATRGRPVGQVGLHQKDSSRQSVFLGRSKPVSLPTNTSWGHLRSILTNIDQQACGSCWAVATITMMNAAEELAGGSRTFSAQDLVNCVPNPHNCGGEGGCSGATVELAMNWIASNGLRTSTDSPYHGSDEQCYTRSKHALLMSSKITGDAQITNDAPSEADGNTELEAMIEVGQHDVQNGSLGQALGLSYWTRLPENEYEPLLFHLVQHGPLAVSVAASAWSSYGRGIFDACNVDAVIDHAVVLFGYGHDDGLNYWSIKNSWSNWWGEHGNIRVKREGGKQDVKCGIDRQPEVGTGCDGGPKEVTVCGHCGILYDVVSVHMHKRREVMH